MKMMELLLPLAVFCTLSTKEAQAAKGGGFADAGVAGEYFANRDLNGAPAFSRRDVRVRFEWGEASAGGSNSPSFARFPKDGFSARWTGRILPRYSERYTLGLSARGGARVYLDGKLVLDAWSGKGAKTKSAAVNFVANTPVAFKMEFRDEPGTAAAHLFWESPSTPREPVEAATINAINAVSYDSMLYADMMRMGRDKWEGGIKEDAQGWPQSDGTFIAWEGREGWDVAGIYAVSFKGLAELSANFGFATFAPQPAKGETAVFDGILPSGAGYDAKTNTTRALMRTRGDDAQILYFNIKNSQRTPDSPIGSGITDIKMMRPIAPGATQSYRPGELFARDLKGAFSHFNTLRWLTANFNTHEREWNQRETPGRRRALYGDRGQVWEYLVMLCNETGKDLYITIPTPASNDYIQKLAQLIRYGSDGVNPYMSTHAAPKYPPLNANLNVYVEWTNEFWNWAFAHAPLGVDLARAEVKNGTPDGKILNFDGQSSDGDFRRFAAIRTVRVSDIFREVWGDANMPNTNANPRVRPLFEFQYVDAQETASVPFRFIDAYFNNGDSKQHVKTPHPVNYFLWGAGGATYYGSGNPRGAQETMEVANANLESEGGWKFTGDAGIYRATARQNAVEARAGAVETQTSGNQAFGWKFTIGENDIAVGRLGRLSAAGNKAEHAVRIYREDGGEVLGATVKTEGVAAGAWAWGAPWRPVTLKANTSYFVASDESGEAWYGADSTLTPRKGITIDAPVTRGADGKWKVAARNGNRAYAVSFEFAPLDAKTGFQPDAPEGRQALYIAGKGQAETIVNFDKPGVYALDFKASGREPGTNSALFFVNDVPFTPRGAAPEVSTYGFGPGGRWSYDYRDFRVYGSAPFTISTAGEHRIRIVGNGGDGDQIFFDEFKVTSLDAIFAGGIPGKGEALGQISDGNDYQKQLNSQARYALAWGLNVVAYEGGWSLGGDADASPLQSHAKYLDARAKQANLDAMTAFARSGGAMLAMGTYDAWRVAGSARAEEYPLLQAIVESNRALPPTPTFGALLDPKTETRVANWDLSVWANQPPLLSERDTRAKAAIVRVASRGRFNLSLRAANPHAGGKITVEVDGAPYKTVSIPQSAEPVLVPIGALDLRAGQHSIFVRALAATAGSHAGDVRELVFSPAAK